MCMWVCECLKDFLFLFYLSSDKLPFKYTVLKLIDAIDEKN